MPGSHPNHLEHQQLNLAKRAAGFPSQQSDQRPKSLKVLIFRKLGTSYNALLAVDTGDQRAVGGRRFEGGSCST
eukprot:6190089-Pleurochrysis_carterae.AAC.2